DTSELNGGSTGRVPACRRLPRSASGGEGGSLAVGSATWLVTGRWASRGAIGAEDASSGRATAGEGSSSLVRSIGGCDGAVSSAAGGSDEISTLIGVSVAGIAR